MLIDEKEHIHHNPQYVVVSTLKSLMLKLHEVVNDLGVQCEQLDKKLEIRSTKLTAYLSENEQQLKELRKNIEDTKKRIEVVESKLAEVDDFFKETKIKISIWKKCLLFIKEFPIQIVTFFGALAAIGAYLMKYFGL